MQGKALGKTRWRSVGPLVIALVGQVDAGHPDNRGVRGWLGLTGYLAGLDAATVVLCGRPAGCGRLTVTM